MANYLPVLLVSVAANCVLDDSAVSTVPRAQVDYLSHDWEEEDVWRSWRNMTRQKNEIANGIRLENASWRTWWKRRNGLGTVTPETLNWLKDSDVTWLYGPLHTASDSTPKLIAPPPYPSSTLPPSASITPCTTHKPILKHRSISQLLTSALHNGARVVSSSPPDNDHTNDDPTNHPSFAQPRGFDNTLKPRRPAIHHTKSDTHVFHWGSRHDIRQDAHLQIDPPFHPTHGHSNTHTIENISCSNTSSDSNPNSASSGSQPHKKRHISFNTYVEQYIAIEKPAKELSVGYDDDDDDDDDEDDDNEDDDGSFLPQGISGRYPYGRNTWGYDDGYEEDEEDSAEDDEEAVSLSIWDDSDGNPVPGSDSDSLEFDGDGPEDDIVRSLPFDTRTKKSSIRSHSTISNTSSCSSASTSTSISTASTSSQSSESQPPRLVRRSSTSTYRPRTRTGPLSSSSCLKPRCKDGSSSLLPSLIDTSGFASPSTTHVTIAPMPPTILKTGAGNHHGAPGGWVEGFGDEGGSDDGSLNCAGSRCWQEREDGKRSEDGSGTEGTSTPVELVYVPPLGSHYMRSGTNSIRDWTTATTRGRPGRKFSVGDDADIPSPEPDRPGATIPSVVIRRPADDEVRHDAFDYLVADEDGHGRGRSGSQRSAGGSQERSRGRSGSEGGAKEERQSRSRSRSRSRTPSPNMVPPALSPHAVGAAVLSSAPLVADPNVGPSRLACPRKSASTSPPASGLLSPPLRGRGSRSHQDLQSHVQAQPSQSRGRSSTRVLPADRDRSLSYYGSSLGSVSPEGIDLGGAYAGGRIGGKDWRPSGERERPRWRDRDRERTGRTWSVTPSLSPDVQSPHDTAGRVASATDVVPESPAPTKSELSSSSSSSSASSAATVRPAPTRDLTPSDSVSVSHLEECEQQQFTPTPSNTPTIAMQTVSAAVSTPPRSSATQSQPRSPTGTTHISRKSKSPNPVRVSAPHPAEPSTSYSISKPRSTDQSLPSSPTSPIRPVPTEPTIVSKAVEIVSSAGAFFGLWNHSGE